MTVPPTNRHDAVRRGGPIDSEVRAAVDAWRDRLRDDAIEPLVTLFRAAADRLEHGISTWEEEGVDRYRQALLADVLQPLYSGLVDKRPGESMEKAYLALLDDLRDVGAGLDEVVVRPEPIDLFESDPSDAVTRRWRKAAVRTTRRTGDWRQGLANGFRRLMRRVPQEAPQRTQRIPMARLVSFHTLIRLPSELQKDHEAACRTVGEHFALIGRTATTCVHAALDPEDTRREAAERLHDVLTRAADDLEVVSTFEDVDDELDAWHGGLQRDIRESATFMLDLARRDLERAEALRRRAEERMAAWSTWYRRVYDRIHMLSMLLEFRATTNGLEGRIVHHVVAESLEPVRMALFDVERRLRRLSEEAREDFKGDVSASDITGSLEKALRSVEHGVLNVLRDGDFSQKARAACDELVVALSRAVQGLPDELELNVLDESGAVDPERAPKRVAFSEHAARAYDALLVERLRAATNPTAEALTAVRQEAESVPAILRFNLGAAADDLQQEGGAAHVAARELVVDGLARSADVLHDAADILTDTEARFSSDVRGVFERGFAGLHDRMRVEERMREQMLDLKSGAEVRLRRAAGRASEQSRRLSTVMRRAYRTGRGNVGRWVRLGRAAAGLAAVTEEERLETVDALADTDRLLDGFPLVYRRLFTFDPVRDPALLEGRDPELRFVRSHLERWRRGHTNALVIKGFHGSGQTSFLNVVRKTVLDDGKVHVLDLRRRVRDEEVLVGMLADALSLDDASASSFDELAELLFEHVDSGTSPHFDGPQSSDPPTAGVCVCIIEHLEHLYLRQIGGTDLLQAFLSFLSKTDSRVLWIVTVSDYGWQVIRTAEASASRLVVVQSLAPLNRAGLEAIIMNRHRRSGLPLRFDTPVSDANPLFVRRYRRASNEAERQALLRTEYFDRLHRASGQNIMLSLLYWLRSVEMNQDEGSLRVRQVEPLRFGFLQSFDLDQAFTLKALLEHASLTVEEHSEVFQMPIDRSVELFEGLGNLLLIESMADRHTQSRFTFATVEESVRYRVRPLIIHPIIQYLRTKNIIH